MRANDLGPILSGLGLALGLSMASSCKTRPADQVQSGVEAASGAGDNSRWLKEWSNGTQKQWWYLTPQGSLFLPMDIFRSLGTASDPTVLFSSKASLGKYGFVYPPASDEGKYNMYGLPLGMVEEPDPQSGGRMTMGYTCAACHTGEIKAKGKRFVVDGGQPMLDQDRYMLDFVAALKATKAHDPQLKSMQARISSFNPQSPYAKDLSVLQQDFEKNYLRYMDRMTRNTPALPGGPGRLDAVSQLLNEVLVYDAELNSKDASGNYINARHPAAPVSLPTLWGAPFFECVQTNCLAKNPLTRNLGEVMGVFGNMHLRFLKNDGKTNWDDLTSLTKIGNIFDTSANLDNLFRLEESLKEMPNPAWPAEVLGALDQNLVAKGKEIYYRKQFDIPNAGKMACVSCHVIGDMNNPESLTPANAHQHKFLRVSKWSPDVVKTDTVFLEEHGGRTVKGPVPPLLVGAYKAFVHRDMPFLKRFNEKEELNALKFFAVLNNIAVKKWFKVHNKSEAEQIRYSSYQEISKDFAPAVYRSRPLTGIAFSAPYLHNGSIPNLKEFFTPPAQRVKSFTTGSIQIDPVNVGFAPQDGQYEYQATRFDTSIRGNSNAGHEWGTNLPAEDKKALIEYLKTL